MGRQQQAIGILFLLDTLSATWLLCLLNDSEVSRWTPKIFGHWTSGSCEFECFRVDLGLVCVLWLNHMAMSVVTYQCKSCGRSLGSQSQHTHSLEDHTWSIQQSTTTHTKHIHNIQQNSNYTHTHCELFHQTIHKHYQARNTQNKQTH